MKYFRHPVTGNVFAFEIDGSQDSYISSELCAMTPEEVLSHLNPVPTEQEVLVEQQLKLSALVTEVDAKKSALISRISTLQDAVEFGIVIDSELLEKAARERQLSEWKQYGVLLGRVTIQPGFPVSIDWPLKPI